MTVRDYSTTPANNNAAPPNGWPEGQAASTVNDCARQMMAEIRDTCEDFPYFDWGDDPTRVDNDTFTLVGDLTARYPVGARIKLVGATTGYARISASAFGAVTTIDVVMDTGNVPTSLVRVAVQPSSGSSETPAAVTLSASAGTSQGISRADHVHALSQAIAPTWSAQHIFSKVATNGATSAIFMSSTLPRMSFNETDGSTDNKLWTFGAASEQLKLAVENDANNAEGVVTTVDRTGTTVDQVQFPADNANNNFVIGTKASVNAGHVQIRTTQASRPGVAIANATAASFTLQLFNEATAGDNSFIVFATEAITGSSSRGSITYNRGGGVVAYNTTSDVRLKENIRDSLNALGLLSNIRVRAFDWKNMPGSAQRYWLVAQEVALVMPEAVSIPEREEDSWSIDVSKLVPLTIKGVQELQAQVQVLAARVAALEGGVAEVKPR